MPPEGLESSVDGLGRPVRAVGVVEEREDVRHAAFEGASERDESGASGRRSPDSEGFDELGHHAPSLPTVLLRVAGDDLLVDAVREGERLVGRVAKQLVGAFLLSVGPETGGLEQDPPAPIERIGPGAAPAGGLALEPAAHGRDLVAGELDDVERVEDLHGMRHLTCGGLLVARERIHRDRLHLLAERLRALGEPLGERLLASALDHVEQSGRPTMPTCISSSRCFVFSHVFFSGLGSCMHFPYFSGCAEVFLPNMRASLTRRLWPVNSRSRPWCTMRSMIAAASLSSAKTVPHLLNSMFVVNMMLRLS